MDPVQEIKSKLSIEEVVASYVPLKKSGKYWKAPCPFHQEKTPSFFVSPERQMAYCFACHKGGDLFQFIQNIEGLDFRAALELLAEKAHVELPKFSPQHKPSISSDEKDRWKAVCADATEFFMQNLCHDGEGEKVREYLKKRGLSEATFRQFELGFSLEGRDDLYRFLLQKGHEKDDILATTLCLARDSGRQDIVDRFRLRLMVPISNLQGERVAFGGRALKKGDEPKYLNSAEYPLYQKSQILYHLDVAKLSIRESDFVLIVEGYFDVMASVQAGLKNTVATCGTALTVEQIRLLKRYTQKLVFAFDADAAGQAALLRAVQVAQNLDLELFVVSIPNGKDAADTVKENPQRWVEAVDARIPYLNYFFEEGKQRFDVSTASGKRAFSDFFLELLRGVKHPVERDHYLKLLGQTVATPTALLYDYLNQLKKSSRVTRVKELRDAVQVLSKHERLARYFLGLILAFPQSFFDAWKRLAEFSVFRERAGDLGLIQPFHRLQPEKYGYFYQHLEEFLGEESTVYKQIWDYYNAQGTVDELFYGGLESADELKRWSFEAELRNSDPDPDAVSQEIEKVLTLLYFETLSEH